MQGRTPAGIRIEQTEGGCLLKDGHKGGSVEYETRILEILVLAQCGLTDRGHKVESLGVFRMDNGVTDGGKLPYQEQYAVILLPPFLKVQCRYLVRHGENTGLGARMKSIRFLARDNLSAARMDNLLGRTGTDNLQ